MEDILQNVKDMLHQKAGIKNINTLHGSIENWFCIDEFFIKLDNNLFMEGSYDWGKN